MTGRIPGQLKPKIKKTCIGLFKDGLEIIKSAEEYLQLQDV